jgi:hypothetical protein
MTLFSIKLYGFGGKKGLGFADPLLMLKITASAALAHSAIFCSVIGIVGKACEAQQKQIGALSARLRVWLPCWKLFRGDLEKRGSSGLPIFA